MSNEQEFLHSKASTYFDYGLKLMEYKQYQKAIIAFEKAELSSLYGIYPDASFSRGFIYYLLNKNEEALEAFEKAEHDSPDSKYSKASYNRGKVLEEMSRLDEAILAYEKAERDGPEGKYSTASHNRGVILQKMSRLEEAILAFEKAERDALEEQSPFFTNSRGSALYKKGRLEEAILAYEKAEREAPNGKYSLASFNRGKVLEEMGQLEEAILAYKKAERDGPEGKYSSASHNRGAVLQKLSRLEEAILAYEKAERDGPEGKSSLSSNNIGCIYGEIGRLHEAILAFEKAERDTPGERFSLASFNRGYFLENMKKFNRAIEAYLKTIRDSENHTYPLAYWRLSVIYSLKGDYSKSQNYAFIAIYQDSKHYEIINHIREHFGSIKEKLIYKNRLKYLNLILTIEAIKKKEESVRKEPNFPWFQVEQKNDLGIFLALLLIEKISFPEPISYRQRLKLAVVLHFIKEDYANCFFLIDEKLDSHFELDEMDYYFYLYSAYKIGEPIEELEYFLDLEVGTKSGFGKGFHENVVRLKHAIDNDMRLDPYLLDCDFVSFNDGKLKGTNLGYHPWLKDALQLGVGKIEDYQVPYSRSQMIAMLMQKVSGWKNEITKEYETLESFDDFIRALDSSSPSKPSEYKAVVRHIRGMMKEKVPFEVPLSILMQRFIESEDVTEKSNITVMQATVMVSYYLDQLKRPIGKNVNIRIVTQVIMRMLASNVLQELLKSGAIVTFGISYAISQIIMKLFTVMEEREKEKSNRVFENLLMEIEA